MKNYLFVLIVGLPLTPLSLGVDHDDTNVVTCKVLIITNKRQETNKNITYKKKSWKSLKFCS